MYLIVPSSSITLVGTDTRGRREVPLTIVKYGQHSLKIVPAKPLGPGEYALSMRAAFLNLFCFGIDE